MAASVIPCFSNRDLALHVQLPRYRDAPVLTILGHPAYREFPVPFECGTLWLRGGQDSKLCRSLFTAAINVTHGGGIVSQGAKDEVKGKVEEVKGKIKEKVGRATNNPRLEDEGTDQKVAGKVQKKVGQVEKVFEE